MTSEQLPDTNFIASAPSAKSGGSALGLSGKELDSLFGASALGDMPRGRSKGTALIFPGSKVARFIANFVRLAYWKGKDFNAAGDELLNRLSPFGIRMIKAEVLPGISLADGNPCIVLDYSKTSFVAKAIRDEIRQVGPNHYLGLVYAKGHKVPIRFWLDFS